MYLKTLLGLFGITSATLLYMMVVEVGLARVWCGQQAAGRAVGLGAEAVTGTPLWQCVQQPSLGLCCE
jgi:hypothetical protein